MLFADVCNWTNTIESPDLDLSMLVFAQVSRKYERLTLRTAEFKIPENENNSPAFHNQRGVIEGGTPWPRQLFATDVIRTIGRSDCATDFID